MLRLPHPQPHHHHQHHQEELKQQLQEQEEEQHQKHPFFGIPPTLGSELYGTTRKALSAWQRRHPGGHQGAEGASRNHQHGSPAQRDDAEKIGDPKTLVEAIQATNAERNELDLRAVRDESGY
ncbi:GL11576 [Drosophila persimilis]|uniref:GL11576 n=1 Tax=Drosophila persimilis TaxID=7234 RepID=B4GBR6_DROPE|nr:GL11576 [Drosophila persimilis]